ncbi:zinc finger E-box-binding homeobox 2-like isoform X2 [Limulus polyphemus]|uniref:Zinc finger E-box-binding homeobox 2-like isoform X2 n=1 Tax=Limulus polyphemus TaxID=6850 RepID=A0ABM1AZP0_LIMPO|nr:zinc finger E-box-binding homeobox 2-like isoform X2 [Limulus polyphemus]
MAGLSSTMEVEDMSEEGEMYHLKVLESSSPKEDCSATHGSLTNEIGRDAQKDKTMNLQNFLQEQNNEEVLNFPSPKNGSFKNSFQLTLNMTVRKSNEDTQSIIEKHLNGPLNLVSDLNKNSESCENSSSRTDEDYMDGEVKSRLVIKEETDERLKTEEDKIQEYLKRSDTAVIFPESLGKGQASLAKKNRRCPSKNVRTILEDYAVTCSHCDEAFAGSQALYALRDHIKTAHQDLQQPVNKKENNKHVCPKCNVSFLEKSHLEKHELLHVTPGKEQQQLNNNNNNVSYGLRKFKCLECEKSFKFKHHLKEHVRIHSGEKPFACPNCNKRFSHSGSYSSHMTSKKCLIVNVKVRKVDTKLLQGRGNKQNTIRPIVPKYHLSSLVAIGSSEDYVPTEEEFSIDVTKQKKPQAATQSTLPLELSLHSVLDPQNPNTRTNYLPVSTLTSVSNVLSTTSSLSSLLLSPSKSSNTDLDFETKSGEEANISDKERTTTSSSPNFSPESDLKAVKKILEIVDETIAKQQQTRDSKNGRSGLLSELLNVPPFYRPLKIPLGKLLSSLKIGSSPIDQEQFQCKSGDEQFAKRIKYIQYDRYKICADSSKSANENVNGENSLENDTINGEDVDNLEGVVIQHENSSDLERCSPRSSIESEDERNPGKTARTLYLNDEKNVPIHNMLSGNKLIALEAFHNRNPNPAKYEIMKMAREIGCSSKIVQAWFQAKKDKNIYKNPPIQIPKVSFTKYTKIEPSLSYEDQSYYDGHFLNIPQYKPQSLLNFPAMSDFLSNYKSVIPSGRIIPPSAHSQNIFFGCGSPCVFPPYFGTHENKLLNTQFVEPDCDLPLDLSLNKERTSPHHENDHDNFKAQDYKCEVINLSQKSSRISVVSNKNTEHCATNGNCVENVSTTLFTHRYEHQGNAFRVLTKDRSAGSVVYNDVGTCDNYPSNSTSPHHEYPRMSVIMDNRPSSPTSGSSLGLNPHSPGSEEIPSSPEQNSLEGRLTPAIRNERSDTNVYPPDSNESWQVDNSKRFGRKVSREGHRIVAEENLKPEQGDVIEVKKKKLSVGKSEGETLYGCDQCTKVFSKQSSLARHKYEHSGQRPHQCSECSKAFKHKHHLTEHKRLHSGEKPFQCQKCLKRFSHSGSFSQHMNHRYSYCKPYRN